MNRKEVIQVMLLLSGNYEGIATKMETQKEIMVDTWGACLSDLDYEIVIKAIKVHIMKSPYPPTIYDIRKNATEILNPSTQRTAIEAWNEAYAMICRGGYMTEEEFEKEVQK